VARVGIDRVIPFFIILQRESNGTFDRLDGRDGNARQGLFSLSARVAISPILPILIDSCLFLRIMIVDP